MEKFKLVDATRYPLQIHVKNKDAAEPEINQKIRDQRIIKGVTMVCAVSLLLWLGLGIVDNGISVFFLFNFVLKLLGLSISGILLWYQQDKENPILQKFYSGGKVWIAIWKS